MECAECTQLFEVIADVTKRHIHQIGRLQIATILHEWDSMQGLQKSVAELETAREQASQNFHFHPAPMPICWRPCRITLFDLFVSR
jgi:hypothetical protein